LAAAIKDTFGVESELVEGTSGIFDVVADETMVFSKYETGRFPEHDEVLEALQARDAS
jgi:selT/selW/selH-like putative selenoprotein